MASGSGRAAAKLHERENEGGGNAGDPEHEPELLRECGGKHEQDSHDRDQDVAAVGSQDSAHRYLLTGAFAPTSGPCA